MPVTEISYVCSPDYWRYLFLSLRSLYASGSSFDRVVINVVSDRTPAWHFDDPRIRVVAVPDISSVGKWGRYWGTNKTHLCASDADRVIYLDTDTLILRPLDLVYRDHGHDLLARPAVGTYLRGWNPQNWYGLLRAAGAPKYPFYSPGFMVFQNSAHSKLQETWSDIIVRILNNELPVKPNRHAELNAFSVAASISGLTNQAMEEWHHTYAMIGESHRGSVVHHLGTPIFYRHYLPIEKEIGLRERRDLPVGRPDFIPVHSLYTRVRHRLRTRLLGSRDHSLRY